MTRIAIVEDEAAVREQLAGYVQRYTRQYGIQFEVTMFTDGVEILEDYRPVYDIIFLDVEMLHLDGMETARRIRELDSDVLLIFITNMAQYAIKGYAVGALDYVLKPVPYFAFSQQLQKAVNQLAKRTRHYLAVPVDGGMRRLDAATIYYIESEGHRVHFYTEDGDFSAPGALKALEEKLTGRLFARCNSGYLVNLAQVSGVQQNTVQVGPHELQISRPKRRAFLAALADYIGVRAHDDAAGHPAAVHSAGRGSCRAGLRAGRAAPRCKACDLCCHGGVGRGAGRVFAAYRQCAAGVVAALHGRGHRVAVPVSVGHAGDEFTGSRLQLRPRVHSGGAGRQRGVAASLLTLAAAAGYSTAFGTAAGGGLHGGLRLFVLV